MASRNNSFWKSSNPSFSTPSVAEVGSRIRITIFSPHNVGNVLTRKSIARFFEMRISKNRAIDFRVSTLPTLWGEKIVMRILDPTSATLGVEKLGFEDFQKELFLEAINRPYCMVLSTLHTNDAPSTLTRLANMGVPPFNIASAVNLIIAQRLARRLCQHCKKPIEIPKPALLKAGFKEEDLTGLVVYGAVGCDACNSGYKGRVGIYQVMPVSEEIGAIIMRGGNQLDIELQARKEGVPDLRQAGLKKVRNGITR